MPNKNTPIEEYGKLLEKYKESKRALIEEFSANEPIDIENLDAEIKELREQFEKAAGDSVKHGHWIHCPEEDENAWRCSECTGGWLLPDGGTPEANNMRFCHRCGTIMDGGADDDSM